MPQQQSENLQLFGLNSLTGIPFNKPVSFNEIPTVNGTGLALEGQADSGNVVYTTGDQAIDGTKTFNNNIVGNGTANRLPNQTANTSDSIITSQILTNIDYAAVSTLTTPSSTVGYLPLGSPRLDSNVGQTWGTNNVPAVFLPFLITKPFQKITIRHVSGTHPTALLQIAIYNINGNGAPSTLIDSGTLSLSSTGTKTLTLAQPRTINGIFYIAMRPTIGNTQWVAAGGTTLTLRGAGAGHFSQFSQIIGAVNPTTMADFNGTLLYRWSSFLTSFPNDLTGSVDLAMSAVSANPIWLCAVHN